MLRRGECSGNPGLLRVTGVNQDIQHDGIRFQDLEADSWSLKAEWRRKTGSRSPRAPVHKSERSGEVLCIQGDSELHRY